MNTIYVFKHVTRLKKAGISSSLHNMCKTTNLLCVLVSFSLK